MKEADYEGITDRRRRTDLLSGYRKTVERRWEVWLLNRGNRSAEVDGNIHFIQADMGNIL